jgi:hypothetical protein
MLALFREIENVVDSVHKPFYYKWTLYTTLKAGVQRRAAWGMQSMMLHSACGPWPAIAVGAIDAAVAGV